MQQWRHGSSWAERQMKRPHGKTPAMSLASSRETPCCPVSRRRVEIMNDDVFKRFAEDVLHT